MTRSKLNKSSKSRSPQSPTGQLVSRPINTESVKQDELGRRPFAEGIAKLVRSYSQLDCLVLGIEGPWGDGKSYTLEQLKIELTPEIEKHIKYKWITFQPWNFTDQQHLIELFLRQLSLSLAPKPSGWKNWFRIQSSRAARKASNLLQRLLRYPLVAGVILVTVAKVIQSFVSLAEWVLGSIGISLAGYSMTNTQATYNSESEKSLARVAKFLKDYADTLDDLKDGPVNLTLEKQRNRIVEALGKADFPYERIIIVIEDLDRLNPNEVRQMMQLVRAVADFPRIIYLLAFDREQVIRALGENAGSVEDNNDRLRYGAGYIRKVVQASFTLPRPSRVGISNVLLKHWQRMGDNLFGGFQKSHYWQSGWELLSSLWPNVREGERVMSRALISINMLGTKLNAFDALVAAHLSEFQPELWNFIWLNPNYFLGGQQTVSTETLQNLVRGDARTKARTLELLTHVFPALETGRFKPHASFRNASRIASDDHFESYFNYSVGDGTIAKEWADKALNAKPGTARRQILERVRRQGDEFFVSFMEGILDKVELDDFKWRKGLPLLVDLGVTFDQEPAPEEVFSRPPSHRVTRLAKQILSRLPSSQKSQAILELLSQWLKDDVRSSTLELVDDIGREDGWIQADINAPSPSHSIYARLNTDDQEKVRSMVGKAISGWIQINQHMKWLEHPNAASMLFEWLRLEPKLARQTIDRWVADDWDFFRILRTMISYVHYSDKPSVRRVSPHGLDVLTGLNLEQINTRIKNAIVSTPNLASNFQDVLDAYEALRSNEYF